MGVEDFTKRTSVISYTRDALADDAGRVEVIARAEGLDAHARSVQVRLEFPESRWVPRPRFPHAGAAGSGCRVGRPPSACRFRPPGSRMPSRPPAPGPPFRSPRAFPLVAPPVFASSRLDGPEPKKVESTAPDPRCGGRLNPFGARTVEANRAPTRPGERDPRG